MEIKVDYLESEIITSGDVHRRKAKSEKKGDATMVGLFSGDDGIDYCYIIIKETGEIKKVPKEFIKVVDKKYK